MPTNPTPTQQETLPERAWIKALSTGDLAAYRTDIRSEHHDGRPVAEYVRAAVTGPRVDRALYSELIHIAAELARGDGFLPTCAEDMNPRLKRADILKTAERQDLQLKDWANRVRQVADKLSAAATASPTPVPRKFIEAFKDTAIKCHIGFKHEGPWDKCEWIECEDRKKMIEIHECEWLGPLTPNAPQVVERRLKPPPYKRWCEEHQQAAPCTICDWEDVPAAPADNDADVVQRIRSVVQELPIDYYGNVDKEAVLEAITTTTKGDTDVTENRQR